MPGRPPVHRPPGTTGNDQERRRAYDHARDSQPWRRWYKTARWQRTRDAQLIAEPLCRMCKDKGTLTPATVCDHVERHNGNPTLFWFGPFQSLCATCHSSDKQREEVSRGF